MRVVRNPGWMPGPHARRLGARAQRPSSDGPLGVGKIPLESGAIQIHGGADPLELGKPVSLGCVTLRDEGWLELVDWLRSRNSLGPWRETAGETRLPVPPPDPGGGALAGSEGCAARLRRMAGPRAALDSPPCEARDGCAVSAAWPPTMGRADDFVAEAWALSAKLIHGRSC